MSETEPRIPRLDVLRCEAVHREPFPRGPVQKWWFWRLYWFSNPGVTLFSTEGAQISLPPGQFYLIPGSFRFAMANARGQSHLFIHFSVTGLPEALWQKLFPLGAAVPSEGARESVRERLCTALHREGARSIQSSLDSQALAALCLAEALSQLSPQNRCLLDSALRAPDLIEQARLYAESVHGNCGVADLAARAHCSPDHFARRFRAVYSVPPIAYLQELRLQRAVDLLINTGKTIEEIAEICGFSDRHYFSRVFSGWSGVGPAAFRRRCRGF